MSWPCAAGWLRLSPPSVEGTLQAALEAAAGRDLPAELLGPGAEAATQLVDRLRAAMDRLPDDPLGGVAERLLDGLAAEALGADRASYATVAEMVVTVVDTHRRTGDRHEDLVTAYDERYRRFAAFRRELQSAAATSTRHGQ